MSGICAGGEVGKTVPFPSAEITLASAFNISCETDIHVDFIFGSGDRLTKMEISKPDSECF